jgi:hypothetical protein
MWVIYDHPADYPREFVARKWVGEEATPEVMCAHSIGALRDALRTRGLARLDRHKTDDPVIVESWL